MTRQDIERDYEVSAHGIIQSLGKFEGEMVYVPYFWDAFLNGDGEALDGDGIRFAVEPDDVAMFPELADVPFVTLYQREDGFVIAR